MQAKNSLVDISTLPDPLVLANDRFVMHVMSDGQWQVVKAGTDGTFDFDPESPDRVERAKYRAVLAFVELNKDAEAVFKATASPVPVYVDEQAVDGNAYADPTPMYH